MNTVPAYGHWQRLLERISIGLFALLAAWGLWRLGIAADGHFLAVVFTAAPCGWLAADLSSGLVHWVLDSCGSVRTPVIGRALIRPFREHHVDPAAMARHDFTETNGASCLGCLPILAGTGWMPLASGPWVFLDAFLLVTALGVLFTNQCHKWVHLDKGSRPALVRWAQRHRLVLCPEHHRLHHTPPFNSHYCTLSGWLNAPLNAFLRAWR